MKGINKDGEKLAELRFADNVALITEDVRYLEHHLNTLNEENLQNDFKIQNEKKIMTNIDTYRQHTDRWGRHREAAQQGYHPFRSAA